MIRRILSTSLIASLLLATGASFAAEPANLEIAKERVIKYHDSGEYNADINHVMAQAMKYLKNRVSEPRSDKKLAIVLDIDETSLSNYPDMMRLHFGGTIQEMRADEDKGDDKAITPTLILYKYAKANNVAVFFITGRYEEERQPTALNLKKEGFKDWNGLILRHGNYRKMSATAYKTAARKMLEEKGYDIIMSIGDQQSDLDGGYVDKTFKLPNPYYFIS